MLLYEENAARRSSVVWIKPTSAAQTTATTDPLVPPRSGHVLLVDEPGPFRERAAAELAEANLNVLQASDVYEALHLARRSEIELLAIGGDQRYQSGWRCAGKLCGRPPWRGVILYFAQVSDRDRLWTRVSQLTALVETNGQSEPLVSEILRLSRP